MKTRVIISSAIFGGVLFGGSSTARAFSFGLEYTAEWQADFTGNYDWLNLLKLSAETQLCRVLSFQTSTVSFAKTGDSPLVEDMLTYSNIETENIPLTLSRTGLRLSIRNVEVFAGINNVNEDYFTSEYTSFFTNSSCGISPTISCNFDIANYPLAAWCLHYRQQLGSFSIQTSLYPGKGFYRFSGHDNLFNLDLKRNGLFSISSGEYNANGIYCNLGLALHYGEHSDYESGEQVESQAAISTKKEFAVAPWILAEISLPHKFGLLAHASYSSVSADCKAYLGLGFLHHGNRVQPGVCVNYASFSDIQEYTLELCARIPVFSGKGYVQPALHLVGTGDRKIGCVAMLRFNLSI